MNREAARHLTRAANYLAKGEDYHRKAADEIIAARAADPTLSNREVGEWFGRGRTWARTIVQWRTTGQPDGIDWQRGSHATTAEIEAGAKKLLAKAPLEQVEQIVASLPKGRQQALAAAAGNEYMRARQSRDDSDRQRTPREQRERDDAAETLTRSTRRAVGDLSSLGIVELIEQATDELRELTADASLSDALVDRIERADRAWREALDFARALVGGDRS
jgi:hypothetical protein